MFSFASYFILIYIFSIGKVELVYEKCMFLRFRWVGQHIIFQDISILDIFHPMPVCGIDLIY